MKLDESNRIVTVIPAAHFESKPNSTFSTTEHQEKGDLVCLCDIAKQAIAFWISTV